MLKNDERAREGDCRESTPHEGIEKSHEEFGSADAYNRPSLPSNKTHTSISPSKEFCETFILETTRARR